ncbi:MAG: helix-turn-helix domain-containing protein [Candidatus Zixiibacteriota bacterium]
MGTEERKEREKLRRRNEILDAAETVFAEKGIREATMEDIAAKAELGKSTVYLYFRFKELIYLGLDWRGSKIEKKMFEKASASAANGLDKVIAIGRAYFEYAFTYPLYFQMKTIIESIPISDIEKVKDEPVFIDFQKVIEGVQKVLLDAIILGMQDGTIAPDRDPLRTGLTVWSTSNGFLHLMASRGEILEKLYGVDTMAMTEEFFTDMRKSLRP